MHTPLRLCAPLVLALVAVFAFALSFFLAYGPSSWLIFGLPAQGLQCAQLWRVQRPTVPTRGSRSILARHHINTDVAQLSALQRYLPAARPKCSTTLITHNVLTSIGRMYESGVLPLRSQSAVKVLSSSSRSVAQRGAYSIGLRLLNASVA